MAPVGQTVKCPHCGTKINEKFCKKKCGSLQPFTVESGYLYCATCGGKYPGHTSVMSWYLGRKDEMECPTCGRGFSAAQGLRTAAGVPAKPPHQGITAAILVTMVITLIVIIVILAIITGVIRI